MMRRYSDVAGLRPRVLIPVPLLTPRLSSLWVGLVTPVPAGLARPLVESLRNEVVCSEHDIARYVPDPPEGLLPLDRAISLALRHTREGAVSTRWSSAATPGAPSDPLPSDPSWAGGSLYVDARISAVRASPAALWRVIEGIGGETGWYSFPAAWAVRGLLDRLAGGVGLRRGRRDPRHLLVGDALDFWRVEAITPGSLLRLRAEMKLPGLAWLEMAAGRDHDGMTTYSQPDTRTGGPYHRSTVSYSAGCSATSPQPQNEPAARRKSQCQPGAEQRGRSGRERRSNDHCDCTQVRRTVPAGKYATVLRMRAPPDRLATRGREACGIVTGWLGPGGHERTCSRQTPLVILTGGG
jgi:hypothetical protein